MGTGFARVSKRQPVPDPYPWCSLTGDIEEIGGRAEEKESKPYDDIVNVVKECGDRVERVRGVNVASECGEWGQERLGVSMTCCRFI